MSGSPAARTLIQAGQAQKAFRDGVGAINTYLCYFRNFDLLILDASLAGDLDSNVSRESLFDYALIR
jgi:hypothetical protein